MEESGAFVGESDCWIGAWDDQVVEVCGRAGESVSGDLTRARRGVDMVKIFSDIIPVDGWSFGREFREIKQADVFFRVVVDVIDGTSCIEELVGGEKDEADVNGLVGERHCVVVRLGWLWTIHLCMVEEQGQ